MLGFVARSKFPTSFRRECGSHLPGGRPGSAEHRITVARQHRTRTGFAIKPVHPGIKAPGRFSFGCSTILSQPGQSVKQNWNGFFYGSSVIARSRRAVTASRGDKNLWTNRVGAGSYPPENAKPCGRDIRAPGEANRRHCAQPRRLTASRRNQNFWTNRVGAGPHPPENAKPCGRDVRAPGEANRRHCAQPRWLTASRGDKNL